MGKLSRYTTNVDVH